MVYDDRYVAAGGRWGPPGRMEKLEGPGGRGKQGIEEMENRGNEAKKWLKTKDITFLNGANYGHFACQMSAI